MRSEIQRSERVYNGRLFRVTNWIETGIPPWGTEPACYQVTQFDELTCQPELFNVV